MASSSRPRLLDPSNFLSGFGILSHRRTTSSNNDATLDAQDAGVSGQSPLSSNSNNSSNSNTPLSSSIQPTLSPFPNNNSASSATSSVFGNKNSTPNQYSVGGGGSPPGAYSPAAVSDSHRLLSTSSLNESRTATSSPESTGGNVPAARSTTEIETVTEDPGEVERGSSRSSSVLPSPSSDQQPLAPHQQQQSVEPSTTQAATATEAETGTGQPRPSSPSLATAASKRQGRSTVRKKQTLLTKALLTYLNFFRIVQPLVSLGTLGTMLPVLLYFRTQTYFPAIQASLYLYTVTLACASFLFAVIYLIAVVNHKPLFWPFTNKHFRQTSKARIGGDLMICMAFCGMWFLSLVGLVIDAAMVDCQKLSSLDRVFIISDGGSGTGTFIQQDIAGRDRFHRICQLEKASMGLAVVSWACWMGVLLVLLYGHFWKRRQVIAERLRRSLGRRHARSGHPSQPGEVDARIKSGSTQNNVSTARVPAHGESSAGIGVGVGVSGSSGTGQPGGLGYDTQRSQESDHCACQNEDGEVGLTGIICHYDADSLRDRSSLRTSL